MVALQTAEERQAFQSVGTGLIDHTQEIMRVGQCLVPHLKHTQFTETKVVTER